MKDCGINCLKLLLLVFNVIFLIFGVVIIAVSCVDMMFISNNMSIGYDLDAVYIAVGVLIILVAVFGCIAAMRLSTKLLYIFIGCLALIILLEFSIGIAAAAMRPQIETSMKSNFRGSFIKSKSNNNDDKFHKDFWNEIQSRLHCCGVLSPEDYLTSEPRLAPPQSCCPYDSSSDKDEELQKSECLNKRSYYKDGCEEVLMKAVHSSGLSVIVCGILFCFLEVAGIVIALWLANSLKNEEKGRNSA